MFCYSTVNLSKRSSLSGGLCGQCLPTGLSSSIWLPLSALFIPNRLNSVRTSAPTTEIKLTASHSSQLIGFAGQLRAPRRRLRAFDMSLCIWLLTGGETGKSQRQRQPYVEHIVSVLQHISPLTAASGLTFGKVNNAWGARLIVSCHLPPAGENSSINITGLAIHSV